MAMLTLEQFEKSIKTLLNFQETMQKVDNLTHKENVGFNDFYFELTNQYVKLIESNFRNPQDEWVSYWLYENTQDKKYVGYKNKEYDIAEIKDLYYWLTEEYDKIKLWSEERIHQYY